MDEADLAIGAASSASWERCTLGLPALLVTLADNQVAAERLLVEAGAAESIGWHHAVSAADIERAVRVAPGRPRSRRGDVRGGRGRDRRPRDGAGRGGDRIDRGNRDGGEMSEEAGAVTLRSLEPDDRARVLAWRNLPDVARYMYTDHRITEAEHARWFNAAINDETKRHWIIELDGRPVGLANLYDISALHRRAYIGLYLADASVRGMGVGSATDRFLLHHAFEDLGLEKLCAEALATNEAGIKVHLHHGFRVDGIAAPPCREGGSTRRCRDVEPAARRMGSEPVGHRWLSRSGPATEPRSSTPSAAPTSRPSRA